MYAGVIFSWHCQCQHMLHHRLTVEYYTLFRTLLHICIPVYVSVHLGYVNMYTCVSQNIMHFLCVTIWLWILLVLYCDIFFTSIVCAALFSNIKLHLFHCNGLVLYCKCITHLSHRFVLMLKYGITNTLSAQAGASLTPIIHTLYVIRYICYVIHTFPTCIWCIL